MDNGNNKERRIDKKKDKLKNKNEKEDNEDIYVS